MNHPRWQKAVIKNNGPFTVSQPIIGRKLWVKVAQPQPRQAQFRDSGRRIDLSSSVEINQTVETGGRLCVLPIEMLELCSEFSDDIPIVTCDEFLGEAK